MYTFTSPQLQDCYADFKIHRTLRIFQAGFQLRQPRGADVTRLVSGSLGAFLTGFAVKFRRLEWLVEALGI